jgi:hypothetical protein
MIIILLYELLILHSYLLFKYLSWEPVGNYDIRVLTEGEQMADFPQEYWIYWNGSDFIYVFNNTITY